MAFHRIRQIAAGFLAIVVLMGGSLVQAQDEELSPDAPSASSSEVTLTDLAPFAEVLARIKQHHADDPNPKQLIEGAIRGMLATLDPYSQYYDAAAYADLQQDTRGKFGGIGIEIGLKQNRLTVISPIEDTPAFRAGILSGDMITEVDGASTLNMTTSEAATQMRGEPGTTVTLTLLREGATEPLVVPLVRDIITVHSVKAARIQENVGYLRLTGFMEPTAAEVRTALETFENGGVKSLILDLRGNPGGLISSAVAVSSFFLKKDDLVVYTKGRETNEEFRVTSTDYQTDLPLAVLINGGSASASEIVAGALRAHRRAILLGSKSFGKASVQRVIPLREGNESAAVKLTIAHYFTPDHVDIHRVGIMPDVELASISPLERNMWRQVRTSEALKTLLEGEPLTILHDLSALEAQRSEGATPPLVRKYQAFLNALSQDKMVLNDDLIRYAVAFETLDKADDYEYDPQVRSAVQYMRAYDVFRSLQPKTTAPMETPKPKTPQETDDDAPSPLEGQRTGTEETLSEIA